MAEHPIQGLMGVTIEKIRDMVNAETIIGDPIHVDDTTIIPVSRVTFGFASGGSDVGPNSNKQMFGGGSGAGVSSADEAYQWTDTNNTWLHNILSEGYGSWCYWSGGHAISNYNTGDIADYGGFNTQLTVYKKGVSGLSRTGGGHNGSNNFAVHYGYADNSGYGLGADALPALTFADGPERVIDHMYVTNTTYALNC